MSDFSPAPRRRPLWRLFIMPVLLLVAAMAWSAFWFFAASQVDVRADAWRAQEAKSGRVYDCARRSVAGFPFRLEVRCDGASVSLQSQTAEQAATQAPITAKLGEILVVAQIYDPKLLIAEFTAPATISDHGQPSMTVNWSKARSSVVGLPAVPERASIVFDDASIERFNGSTPAPLGGAKHIELHGRLAEGSVLDHPVIETAFQVAGGSVQGLHPLLAQPFDADMRTMLSGLKDFSPKPWPQRFREIQAAGGHVEIVQSRIQQGDLIAVAAGTLGLTANGRLDGELQMGGARGQDAGYQQSDGGARPRDPGARQGDQAERQCRCFRRHQRAREGSCAGRQKGASISVALCRWRGVSGTAEGGADPAAVLKFFSRRPGQAKRVPGPIRRGLSMGR